MSLLIGLLFLVALVATALLLMKRQGGRTAQELTGRLAGPGAYQFDIVGESKYQAVLEEICGGRTEESAEHYAEALLYLEDSNPFDNQAVRVDIAGKTVGYLSRDNARAYRKQLRQLGHSQLVCCCNAVVVGGWRRAHADEGHFGVKLDLPVV
jgi:hypothetical protein